MFTITWPVNGCLCSNNTPYNEIGKLGLGHDDNINQWTPRNYPWMNEKSIHNGDEYTIFKTVIFLHNNHYTICGCNTVDQCGMGSRNYKIKLRCAPFFDSDNIENKNAYNLANCR